MDLNDLTPGTCVEFLYPRHNFRAVKSRLELRRIKVDRIRNLRDEPLDPWTRENQPLLRRGRHLVLSLDLDKQLSRAFYWERMRRVRVIDTN